MAKNSITDYSKTAASNTDIQSVDIDEGCLPSGINNAIREVMADLAEVNDGTVALTSPQFASADIDGGTIDGTVIGGTTAAAGTFTSGTFTGSVSAQDATFSGNTSVKLPAGTEAQRPTGVNGMLRYNSDEDQFEGYADGEWGAIAGGGETSFLQYNYTATAGQTTFSGSDDNSATLSYTASSLMVTLNGILLENGTDYTATNGTSIVLTDGAALDDELNVVAFKTFLVADTVPASTGGTFSGDVTVTGDTDITGTVTAYTLSLNETSDFGIGTISSDTNWGMYFRSDNVGGSDPAVADFNFASNANESRLRIASNGDISFYEDTGTTAKLFWDASAEALGIGTSSPTLDLSVDGDIWQGNGGGVELGRVFNDAGVWHMRASGNVNGLALGTNGTERMRIDSSGNVLVGKTTTAFGTQGIRSVFNGQFQATATSNEPLALNRLSTDGPIADFYKDSAKVGSIGVEGGDNFYITDNNNTGLNMKSGFIIPCNTNGSTRDNAIDLGASGGRFNDLYLGGGVYLGGTGSANHLDDYEEGSWTPTFSRTGTAFTTTPTYTNRTGRYIKVGKLVHATCNVRFSTTGFSGGSGNFKIDGLPFSSSSHLQGISFGIMSIFTNNMDFDNGNYVSGTTVQFSGNNVIASNTSLKYLTFTVQYEAS